MNNTELNRDIFTEDCANKTLFPPMLSTQSRWSHAPRYICWM